MPVQPLRLRQLTLALTFVALFGARAEAQTSALSILNDRDPLSCLNRGTTEALCAGASGAWQLGRLALAVEASAKAFELAGIGFDSEQMQAAIFAGAQTNGFDLSLVTPTASLFDMASLGTDGPLGAQADTILGLTAFSLEALYPGMASALDVELVDRPGFAATGGFASFVDYARGLGSGAIGATGFESFMPVRPDSLAGSTPALMLIPGTQGVASADFAMAPRADLAIPGIGSDSPLVGMTLTLAFADTMRMQGGTDVLPQQGGAFGATTCLRCGDPSGLTPGAFQAGISFQPADALPAQFGGQFLDGFANGADQMENGPGLQGNAAYTSSCMSTCTGDSTTVAGGQNTERRGEVKYGIGMVTMIAGGLLGQPEVVLGGAALAADGTFDVRQGQIEQAKGVAECRQVCPTEPDDGGADDGGANNGGANNGGANNGGANNGGANNGGANGEAAVAGGMTVAPDAGPVSLGAPNPQTPTGPANPEGCDAVLGPLTYCPNSPYTAQENTCMANAFGEVGCFNANVVASGAFFTDTMFVNRGGEGVPLVELNAPPGITANLVGDLIQAAAAAAVDPRHFDFEAFQPVRGGNVDLPLGVLVRGQPAGLFGGFTDPAAFANGEPNFVPQFNNGDVFLPRP